MTTVGAAPRGRPYRDLSISVVVLRQDRHRGLSLRETSHWRDRNARHSGFRRNDDQKRGAKPPPCIGRRSLRHHFPQEGFFNNPSPVGFNPHPFGREPSEPQFPAFAAGGLSRRWSMLERPSVGLRFSGGGRDAARGNRAADRTRHGRCKMQIIISEKFDKFR